MTKAPITLSDREADRIYERRIRPDFLDGLARSASPTAVLVGGQPGAGRAHAAARIRSTLSSSVGPSVVISADELREYGSVRQPEDAVTDSSTADRGTVGRWYARLIEDTLGKGVNVIVVTPMRDAQATVALANLARRGGYDVSAVVLATPRDLSRQANVAAYDLSRQAGLTPHFVDARLHDSAFEKVRGSLALLESERAVRRLQVVAPDGRQLYANQLDGDQWRRDPRAVVAFDDFRERALTPRELADSALRWETLTQRLTTDSTVPRAVAGQTVAWRNEALARAEAEPEAAKMMQWGREAEAFRAMEKEFFVREFPQHAKATERLDEAVRFAQSNFEDALDRERFVAQATNRLAERIAEGRTGERQDLRDHGERPAVPP